ncbi:DNA-binding domain-containing protein, partial [Bacteroides sp.]
MKKQLKGWLADNTVTGENKGEKILVLENAGSLTLDDVLDEMKKEDTGLRKETLAHAVDLYHRTLSELVLNGYSVNTGMFRIVPQFKGLVEDGVWNPETNSIYVLMQQDKVLRDAIAQTSVKILGEKGSAAYIIGSQDTATRATDGSATPGRTFRVKGKNIKVVGT